MITKEQVLKLKYGDILLEKGKDGKIYRWRVNGKVKTWKRDKERFEVPLKHGLYTYGTLNEYNADGLTIEEENTE